LRGEGGVCPLGADILESEMTAADVTKLAVAGSGEAPYRAFLDRIRAFRVDWREFFLSRAKAGASLAAQDCAAMPKFAQADEELMRRPPAGFAGPLIGVAVPTLILAIFAWRGLRRCGI